jgi:hypothetical protein
MLTSFDLVVNLIKIPRVSLEHKFKMKQKPQPEQKH